MQNRHSLRNPTTGRFISRQSAQQLQQRPIVNGRLYGYRGMVVRAGQVVANGKRHVSFHKQLHGFVNDTELHVIPKEQVTTYLQNVQPK